MAEKKKRPVGRPRKVVDNTKPKAEPKPTLKEVLTLEQRMAIGKSRNAMARILVAYRNMEHPTMDHVFALDQAYEDLRDLYHAAWADK